MKSGLKTIATCLLAILLSNLFSCQVARTTAPKNVIIIIGDGAGFNQLQAGSLYLYGEENALIPFTFPVQLAASTYSASGAGYTPEAVAASFDYLKEKPTDSAAAATALSTGSKTYNGAIGVDTLKQPLTHIFAMAEKKGKATGVVTSVPLSHATPAGFVAHNEGRGSYHDIAAEMIKQSATDVILGCGHPFFDENSHHLLEPNYHYVSQDVWEILQEGSACADADGDGEADPWTFIEFREDFQRYGAGEAPKRLLGMAQVASTLQANRDGANEQKEPFTPPLNETVPTLVEMARAAINVLENDPDGFYLMIEAGAIDWACHSNSAARLVEEVMDMENMMKAVVEWVETNSSWDETLVLATADHETGYLLGPTYSIDSTDVKNRKAVYTPLLNNGQGHMPGLQFFSDGHTNSLVPFFAKGAGSKKYLSLAVKQDPQHGSYIDNTDIPNRLKSFLADEN